MPRLDVGDGHQLHYELHGNPKGKPVVVLHGGPGGGLQRWTLRLFNLRKWHVLLYDQRGAGRSTPSGSLTNNTTWHLVEDIEQLRNEVMHVARWTVFGGSWGSTLALAYAARYPAAVHAMILRGVYLGEPEENDWMYSAKGGAAQLNPAGWRAFVSGSGSGSGPVSSGPSGCRTTRACLSAYAKRFRNRKTRKAAVKAWNKWERDLSALQATDSNGLDNEPLATIENHYFRHNGWLQPGELIAAAATMSMPVVIVQGRHDHVCPPVSAERLAAVLPSAQLIVTEAGHAASEPATAKALRAATDKLLASH